MPDDSEIAAEIKEISEASNRLKEAMKSLATEQAIANEVIDAINSLDNHSFLQVMIDASAYSPGNTTVKLRRKRDVDTRDRFYTTSSQALHFRLRERLLPAIRNVLMEIIRESMIEQKRLMTDAGASIIFDDNDERTPRGVKIRKAADEAEEEESSGGD